jgi:Na+-driven multidrug efflux pump
MGQTPQIKLNLLHLSWPIFIEELTGGLVTLTDTLFLCMLSDKVAASIGMLGSVMMLGFFILPQFSGAGTSVSAQYMGAGKEDHVVPTYIGNLVISMAMGTLLALTLFALSGKIGLWLGMRTIII